MRYKISLVVGRASNMREVHQIPHKHEDPAEGGREKKLLFKTIQNMSSKLIGGKKTSINEKPVPHQPNDTQYRKKTIEMKNPTRSEQITNCT